MERGLSTGWRYVIRRHVPGTRPATLLTIVLCLLVLPPTTTFNVDILSPRMRQDTETEDSMFGFTVSQYKDRNNNWILVGAPRAQTSQPAVYRGGAVYRCDTQLQDCQQIAFDTTGVDIAADGNAIENKTLQWFGASLHSSSQHGLILACAPLYIYFTAKQSLRAPIGNCFLHRTALNDTERYNPCKTYLDAIRDPKPAAMQCLLGESAAISRDGADLVMGAPGMYYFQGGLIKVERASKTTSRSPENAISYDDTYEGYSVVTGDMNNDGIEDYIVGRPRQRNLRGEVSAYSRNGLDKALIQYKGEQLGEYFGCSLAVGDFNADRKDDIAIGAPLYADYSMGLYEAGRVYVFYQDAAEPRAILLGTPEVGARFGHAVAAIGDVNKDSFTDLAVGAPYEDAGRGALYVFHGSARGLRQTPYQVIRGGQLPITPPPDNFGYSISGGLDQDGNVYPDIVVGAFGSNQVIFLRSRPVIQVSATVRLIPPVIDLSKKTCNLADGTAVTCLNISTCVSYSGVAVPNNVALALAYRLDGGSLRPRMLPYNDTGDGNLIHVNKTAPTPCWVQRVYIVDSIRDKLRPITLEMNYTLIEEAIGSGAITPILDVYRPSTVITQAQISKDCGEDDVCIPDLKLEVTRRSTEHVLGREEELDVALTVRNTGEDAYEARLRMTLPPAVTYVNIHEVQADAPIACDAYDEGDEGKVVCDIGNPLRANSAVSLAFRLSPMNVIKLDSSSFSFVVNVSSVNKEVETDKDNSVTVDIPLKAIVNIELTGVSKPEQVLYNSTTADQTKEKDPGPEVKHLFEITNAGPSSISVVETLIYWPSVTADGKPLFYIVDTPKVTPEGSGQCRAAPGVINPNNITTDERPDDRNNQVSRRRREAMVQAPPTTVHCTDGDDACAVITCDIRSLDTRSSVFIEVRSWIWRETLVALHAGGSFVVKANSIAVAKVKDVPYSVKPDTYDQATQRVDTLASPLDQGPGKEAVPLWIIIVAIVGGVLLLLILVLIFYKCGFFRRKKAEDLKKLTQEEADAEKVADAAVPPADPAPADPAPADKDSKATIEL